MKKAIESTKQTFESSCIRTPQYLEWHRLFKREFSKFLRDHEATEIHISKPNHFDLSGFFKVHNQIYWFRIEDLRWSKDKMLIRTAENWKDFTGGFNRYASLSSVEYFTQCFEGIVI